MKRHRLIWLVILLMIYLLWGIVSRRQEVPVRNGNFNSNMRSHEGQTTETIILRHVKIDRPSFAGWYTILISIINIQQVIGFLHLSRTTYMESKVIYQLSVKIKIQYAWYFFMAEDLFLSMHCLILNSYNIWPIKYRNLG